MKKTYNKPVITALGLLRDVTKQTLSGGDPNWCHRVTG